ncbi:MAG: DUF5652 family protein [Actinobacteria bacterium]|nr:DUF5652 family protein [Actinomycetota bacterium]
MDFNSLSQIPTTWFFALYLWSILWKGLALWKAAGLKQRNWFVGLLVLNTVGILDIAYLFFFAKKKMTLKELKFWETK